VLVIALRGMVRDVKFRGQSRLNTEGCARKVSALKHSAPRGRGERGPFDPIERAPLTLNGSIIPSQAGLYGALTGLASYLVLDRFNAPGSPTATMPGCDRKHT